MRWIAESFAEQAFGRRGIAQRRQQEVDSGTRGIDRPIEITPTALHSNVRLIDTPGFVGRLEMTAQPLFQRGAVTLNPTPDRRVIRRQTALAEQLFDIAQRERVAKIPAYGTQNQLWRRLPPLEDCRSGCGPLSYIERERTSERTPGSNVREPEKTTPPCAWFSGPSPCRSDGPRAEDGPQYPLRAEAPQQRP